MIKRDDALSREQKDRQIASMQEVVKFCSNKTDCRRSQVLAFFSETFDPADCHDGCDVCLSRGDNVYVSKDVSEDAKKVLRMMQAFDKRDRITLVNAVNCFRGTGGNTDKGLGQNPLFGVGKDWAVAEAERLVQLLLMDEAIEEYYIQNTAGYHNGYLRVCREEGCGEVMAKRSDRKTGNSVFDRKEVAHDGLPRDLATKRQR